jgi:hypothetical protein
MGKSVIFLLLLLALMPCTAFYASPVTEVDVTSLDVSDAMKQAALILNVPEPENWSIYMNDSFTAGTTGKAQVGSTTVGSVMASWSIPNEFLNQAVQSVQLLVSAATEGSYIAQGFYFDIQSGTSLATLLVVVRKLDSPSDPNSPVAIAYVIINTNATIIQQYTSYVEESCHRCSKCWHARRCCCDYEKKYSPRGNTPEELHIMTQKMIADQFSWFGQQPLSRMTKKRALLKRALLKSDYNNYNASLTEVIKQYLSHDTVRAEVLTSYNDSILSVLQSNTGLLKLGSQSLKLTKVDRKNVVTVISALAKDYDFEDIYLSSPFSQQLQSERFSQEYLFTSSINNGSKDITIKYIWIVGQEVNNSSYSMNFLCINITSQILINTLLSNDPNINQTHSMPYGNEQLKVERRSTLNDDGQFINEHLLTMITLWQLRTTKTAMNILRFVAASTLIPQGPRMLSYFSPETITPGTNFDGIPASESRAIAATIIALSKAVSAAASAWKDIVSAFKSDSSTTITRIIRFGFKYFNEKSTVTKAMNIPADKATEFIKAMVIDYDLPAKGSFAMGLTYSDDFAWDRVDYLYSPTMNGTYRSLTLFKNADSLTNTASFFIIDIDAGWQLAPDLLIIQTSTSKWGGLLQKNEQSIEEVPHVMTLDEAVKLQQFFMLVAMGNIASTLQLNVTLPSLD